MCLTFEVSFVELWRDITRAGYYLVPIVAMWALLYVMNTVTWRMIILGSGPCPVSFLYLLKLTVTGFALNYATPLGLLGGEPYKIMEMTGRIGAGRATSSVVLFSMMHVFAHFWYWVSAIALYVILSCFSILPMNAFTAVILALMAAFCLSGVYLFMRGYRNGMVRRLFRILASIPGCSGWAGRFIDRHAADLEKIDRQISGLHEQNRRVFYLSFFMEYVGRILQSVEIFLILLIFDYDASVMTFVHAFLILAFTSLFANLLFFFPLQLGGREGGFAMSTAQMGMTTEIGIFVSIICRVREIFWVAVGMALLLLGPKNRKEGPTD